MIVSIARAINQDYVSVTRAVKQVVRRQCLVGNSLGWNSAIDLVSKSSERDFSFRGNRPLRQQILKGIVLAIFVSATLNLGAQFYRGYQSSIESERADKDYGVIACKLGPSMDEASRFYIELALLIALIGSRIKHLKGWLLYKTGLLATIASYIFWWRYYFVLAKISEGEMRFVRHIAYLYNATSLDICIAVSVGLLFLWEIRSLVLQMLRLKSSPA